MGRPRHHEHPIDKILGMVEKRFNLSRLGAEFKLDLTGGTTSRIRSGQYPVTARIILNIYDTLGLSIEEIRKILEITK